MNTMKLAAAAVIVGIVYALYSYLNMLMSMIQ